MLPRLAVEYPPFRAPWLSAHAGCRTAGRTVLLRKAGSRDPNAILMGVWDGHMDPLCFAAFEQRSGADPNLYQLAVVMPTSRQPLVITADHARLTVRPGMYIVINPRDKDNIVQDTKRGITATFLIYHQPMLRACREAAGIPSTAGPFDFEHVPRRLSPELRRAVTRLSSFCADGAQVPPAAPHGGDGSWLPLQVFAAATDVLTALWHTHPSTLRDHVVRSGAMGALEPILMRAIGYMQAHLGDKHSNLQIARAAGVSEPTLYRTCIRRFGCAPHELLRRLRVEEAERVLGASTRPDWYEIASAVGFHSVQSLREAFRAVRGFVPRTPRRA